MKVSSHKVSCSPSFSNIIYYIHILWTPTKLNSCSWLANWYESLQMGSVIFELYLSSIISYNHLSNRINQKYVCIVAIYIENSKLCGRNTPTFRNTSPVTILLVYSLLPGLKLAALVPSADWHYQNIFANYLLHVEMA